MYPPEPARPQHQGEVPRTGLWLGLAIFVTACGCQLLGAFGILYAVLAKTAGGRGELQKSAAHLRKARIITVLGLVVTVLLWTAGILAFALDDGSGSTS